MIKNLYIPITFDNIDNLDFEYKGKPLSEDEYATIDYSFEQNRQNKLNNEWQNSNFDNGEYILDYSKKNIENIDTTEGYKLVECETNMLDSNEENIDDGYFLKHFENGKKFILIVDINPSSMNEDSQSEMRYWIEDSDLVLRNKKLEDSGKIKVLPKTHFGVKINNIMYKLEGCKLIEMYKVKNHPYKFAILVERIIKY